MSERCQTVTVVYHTIYSVNVKQLSERCQTVTEVVYHTIYSATVKQLSNNVRQAVKQLQNMLV